MKNECFFILLLICLSSCVKNNTVESAREEMNFKERKSQFISEGFGFKYDLEEYDSKTIFIKNHGKPIQTTISQAINRYNGLEDKLVTLEYPNLIITFYEWNENIEGDYPESMMLSIESKDNCEYLFGIKNGMTVNELENIIGEARQLNNEIWIYDVHIVRFEIENNKIKSIVWHYTLE